MMSSLTALLPACESGCTQCKVVFLLYLDDTLWVLDALDGEGSPVGKLHLQPPAALDLGKQCM